MRVDTRTAQWEGPRRDPRVAFKPMILQVSAQMFLVILVGWLARRRGYLSAESTSALGRLIIDVTVPALIFTQVLKTMDQAVLLQQWYVPLLGAGFILAGQLVGSALAPFVAPKLQQPTVIFLVALSNWTFLPLPIAQALFGAAGTQAVLLMNIGAQALLWTLCVWRLARNAADTPSTLKLLMNPGLVATAASVLLLLANAPVASWAKGVGAATGATLVLRNGFSALEMVASLTVPLSMLVTGGQLAGAAERGLRLTRPIVGVLAGRLLLTPLLMVLALAATQRAGLRMAPIPVHVAALIAGMPAAVSCGAFCDRYGGDVDLATQVVFASTLAGLVTVPVLDGLLRWVAM